MAQAPDGPLSDADVFGSSGPSSDPKLAVFSGGEGYATPEQTATLKALDRDLDQPAGSYRNPMGEIPGRSVPEGQWYVSLDGHVKQAPKGGYASPTAVESDGRPASPPLPPAAQAGDRAMADADVFGPNGPEAPGAGDAAPLKSDEGLGVFQGFNRVFDNAAGGAKWLMDKGNPILALASVAEDAAHVPGSGDPLERLGGLVGIPTTQDVRHQHQAVVADAAKQGRKPGALGDFAGSTLAQLPLAFVPGGPAVAGGMSGALDTQSSDPLSVLRDTAIGAAAGKALHFAGKGVADIVAPRIAPQAQLLLDKGVRLTTDQMTGGKGPWGWAGKFAQVLPGAGELARMRGNEALTDFNRAFVNTALDRAGLPSVTGDNGHDLYTAGKRAFGQAYDAVGAGKDVPIDGQYAADMQGIRQDAQMLPPDLQKRLDKIVNRELVGRLDPSVGGYTAEGLTNAKSALNSEIGDLKDAKLWEKDYRDLLKRSRAALTDQLGRNDPQAKADLARLDAAYPQFKAYERAVRNSTNNSLTPDGLFTPQHAQSAINFLTTDSQRAAGTGPAQELVDAGKAILPRKFKDVASPSQMLIEGLIGAGVTGADVLGGHAGGMGAGLGLALPQLAMAPLYLRGVQNALRYGLQHTAATRGQIEAALGAPVEGLLARPAAVTGGALAQQLAGLLGPVSVPMPAAARQR